MTTSGRRATAVALPEEVLRRGRVWARLAEVQARGVARIGRIGVILVVTLVVCVVSLVLNVTLSASAWGLPELRNIDVWIRPVVIPAIICPVVTLPLLSLLEHLRRLSLGYRYLAEHDPLTGVHNRNGLRQLARQLPADTVVVLADVDEFKLVNDRFGHDEGDQLLLTVVDRLRALCGENAPIARLGGDEFVVLLAPEAGRTVRIPREMLVSSGKASARVSLGSALFGHDLRQAIIDADLAMYRSKPGRQAGEVDQLTRRAPAPQVREG